MSVILPCFNAADTIARAVAGVRTQSRDDWELLVADDGSTDGSAGVVESLAAGDARIRLIRLPHRGVVSASLQALSLARGRWIARVDADDVCHPLRLETQRAYLEANPAVDVASCRVRFVGDADAAAGYAHHVAWANAHQTPDRIALARFVDLPVPHPTWMFRRTLLETHGTYRAGHFPEDYELMLRWTSRGVRFGKVAETLLDWFDSADRLSRTGPAYTEEAFRQCKAPYLAEAIAAGGCDGRDLWIWGAGRPARKAARPLEQIWKSAAGFIDIDPRKIGRLIQDRPVVGPDRLPDPDQAVIVSMVGSRGAGDLIRDRLRSSGRREGVDFWIAT